MPLVRFVESSTGRPVGMAFRVCAHHQASQKVPENRMLEVLDDSNEGGCYECQPAKYLGKLVPR